MTQTKNQIIRFLPGRGPVMIHPQYGEGRAVSIFKRNKIQWICIEINDHFTVETPKSEWSLKDFSL